MNRVKLMVVGPEGSGKTLLIAAVTSIEKYGIRRYHEFLPESTEPTKGVDIQYRNAIFGETQVDLHIWDFSGNELYSAAQSYFLTDQSIYLVVWNISTSIAERSVIDN